ncbi:hypothetical protein ACTFIR_002518 [Dictyostelium discoideum]
MKEKDIIEFEDIDKYVKESETSRIKFYLISIITFAIMIGNEIQFYSNSLEFTVIGCRNITSIDYEFENTMNTPFPTVNTSNYSLSMCINSRVPQCLTKLFPTTMPNESLSLYNSIQSIFQEYGNYYEEFNLIKFTESNNSNQSVEKLKSLKYIQSIQVLNAIDKYVDRKYSPSTPISNFLRKSVFFSFKTTMLDFLPAIKEYYELNENHFSYVIYLNDNNDNSYDSIEITNENSRLIL